MDLQPLHLRSDNVELHPLQENDFEALFSVASDPLVWAQHPNPDRYREDVFRNFFNGAMQSGGAFIIRDAQSGAPIGSTRFYDHLPGQHEVKIGYTFFSRDCWGKSYNRETKALMLDHAFRYVDRVLFHVGTLNIRSRTAMERLGAVNIGEEPVAYFGEAPRMNVVYLIAKEDWKKTGAE